MAELSAWDSFYIIVGPAAGALIGLQFVVMTLVAERPPREANAGRAFSTPTIVHFCAVLLISSLVRAPWWSLAPFAVLMALIGIAGTIYVLVTAWRMRVQTAYAPDFEDWLCHSIVPLLGYAVLIIAAFMLMARTADALFAIGGATLLLLFIAIHNSWDAVAFQVFARMKEKP